MANCSELAEELGEAIAGTEVTVIAADSSCPVPSSCPDIASVDLPDRSALSQVEIAAIAAELGWDVSVVDDRLFTIANDDDMSGSVSGSSDGRVGLVIGEDRTASRSLAPRSQISQPAPAAIRRSTMSNTIRWENSP